ncbi:MAG: [acyl-carrier-protein] S-malonyltransferase [Candidatus Azotimanducaceae bacterium]|jgi:[acyl-carrier-protein] S-malonyltransferase
MGKLAYVFPGQGSQSVGMLSDLATEQVLIEETFAEASEALGYDLWKLIQSGPEDKLNQTEFTQPALLSASVAIWRVAVALGATRPDVVAGHSLGEYSALVAAGSLQFTDAVKLVQQRGQFMQTAVPIGQGGMAAVLGLEDEVVREVCAKCSSGTELVQAANYNAPGQVVIAGSNAALELAIEALKDAGAKRAIPLAVSAPFHSALMRPAAEKMAVVLADITISIPTIHILQNVDAVYHSSADAIRSNLVAQMYSAVMWTETTKRMALDGVSTIVECGPGKVLTGLNKRIDKSIDGYVINSVESLASTLESLG